MQANAPINSALCCEMSLQTSRSAVRAPHRAEAKVPCGSRFQVSFVLYPQRVPHMALHFKDKLGVKFAIEVF